MIGVKLTCLNVLIYTPFSHKNNNNNYNNNNNNNLTYDVFLLILIFCFKHARPPINRVVFRSISCRYIGKREDFGPGDKVNSAYSLAVFDFTFSRLLELQILRETSLRTYIGDD